MPQVLLAFGANRVGPWGTPEQTIARAIELLSISAIGVLSQSRSFKTLPVGSGLQSSYCNIAVSATTESTPRGLLVLLKRVETAAGRGLGGHWSSRTLDIDLIDYNGVVIGWPPPELRRGGRFEGRREPGRLVLPHPQAHRRRFVLDPVQDVMPHWRHPAIGLPVGALIRRLDGRISMLGSRPTVQKVQSA